MANLPGPRVFVTASALLLVFLSLGMGFARSKPTQTPVSPIANRAATPFLMERNGAARNLSPVRDYSARLKRPGFRWRRGVRSVHQAAARTARYAAIGAVRRADVPSPNPL